MDVIIHRHTTGKCQGYSFLLAKKSGLSSQLQAVWGTGLGSMADIANVTQKLSLEFLLI